MPNTAPRLPAISRRSIALALAASLVGASLFAMQRDAHGYANSPTSLTGRTLKSSSVGCGGCHGAAADAGIAVAISGPTALDKGQAATYTITATRAAGIANGTKMGLAVASSDTPAPLAVVTANTTVVSEQVIHASGGGALNTTTGNSASYQVAYTMPAAAAVGSAHTLYSVAVLAYPGGWNHAPNFSVTTRPVAPTSATASSPTASSINLAWTGTGPEYRVVYKTGATPPVSATDGTTLDLAASTSTTVSGLAASTQYSFAVYSKLTGSSVFSSSAPTSSATTTAAPVASPRHVNAVTGSDTSTCASAAAPCRTITYAMGQASSGAPGDLINVAPGLYNMALGEAFPITMKSGVQLKSTGEGAVIDAAGANKRLFDSNGNNSSTLIEGFTLKNGFAQNPANGTVTLGGAISCSNGSAIRISRNAFINNEARGYDGAGLSYVSGGLAYGGAIYVASVSPVTIVDNVFIGNTVRGGHGVDNFGTSTPGGSGGNGQGGAVWANGGTIVNNTFHGNQAIGGAGGFSLGAGGAGGHGNSGAVYASFTSVVNNIFSSNSAAPGAGGGSSPPGVGGTAGPGALSYSDATATNNLFFANVAVGQGNSGDYVGANFINADPRFHYIPDNLRIGFPSPARAAGTASGAPPTDFDNVARPNPPSIGAFEASGYEVTVTDFNLDDRSDIIYRNATTGQIYIIGKNGLGTTGANMVYQEPNTAWKVIADADFTGDGVTDLLWRNSTTGQVYLMPFAASGLPAVGSVIYSESNPAWKIVQTPDIDGDGKADLLWWNSSTGQVYAMLMNGTPIGTQGIVYTEPNTQWQIVASGDFSGSGKQNQLVWRNVSTAQIYLMTVTVGGGTFAQSGQVIYQATVPYKIVAAMDFNGDGRTDILWRNDSTGQVYLMLMNGPAILFEGVIYTEANQAWKIVAAGDYNGDGKADILWRNETTGQAYMMLMNGASISSQGLVYTEPNTQWRILGPHEYSQ